jgi:hypothetical protein
MTERTHEIIERVSIAALFVVLVWYVGYGLWEAHVLARNEAAYQAFLRDEAARGPWECETGEAYTIGGRTLRQVRCGDRVDHQHEVHQYDDRTGYWIIVQQERWE